MPPFIAMPLARARLDVSTAGTFVGALHFASQATNTTVNGVTFTGIDPGLFTANTITSGNFTLATPNPANHFGADSTFFPVPPFSNLSASYQSLLKGHLQINNTPPTMTLTMNNLVAGATYQFEWWNSDSSGNLTTTATSGNAVSLQTNPTFAPGGLGQYAIGTFLADATTSQAITFAGNTPEVLNGFQLRKTADPTVPEPGTALFGLALLAPALTRRARRV